MLYQQGDVLIESVSKLPDDAKKINASSKFIELIIECRKARQSVLKLK